MRQASKRIPDSAEKTVRDIRRATRRHHSAEDKICESASNSSTPIHNSIGRLATRAVARHAETAGR